MLIAVAGDAFVAQNWMSTLKIQLISH